MEIITVSKLKRFIIAKTVVEKQQLFKSTFASGNKIIRQIEGRAGYNTYWLNGNNWELFSHQNIVSNIIEIDKETEKKLPNYVNICWVAKTFQIEVPLGFELDEKSYNCQVNVKINNVEKFLTKSGIESWEQETRGGLTYEYLSEYFVVPNSETKQHGLSIMLRNAF